MDRLDNLEHLFKDLRRQAWRSEKKTFPKVKLNFNILKLQFFIPSFRPSVCNTSKMSSDPIINLVLDLDHSEFTKTC